MLCTNSGVSKAVSISKASSENSVGCFIRHQSVVIAGVSDKYRSNAYSCRPANPDLVSLPLVQVAE